MKKASDNPTPETFHKFDMFFELEANYPDKEFVGQSMRRKADEHYGAPQPWPRYEDEPVTTPTFKKTLGNKQCHAVRNVLLVAPLVGLPPGQSRARARARSQSRSRSRSRSVLS